MRAPPPERAVASLATVMSQCEGLAGAELCFPFGEDVPVFKVGGKMFAVVSAGEGAAVTLKCDPGEAAALCRSEPGIMPGYHMNKRHWITVALAGVAPDLVADLVGASYEIVVSSLPRGRRPMGG